MATYAIIEDSIVVNVVLWDGEDDTFDNENTVKIDGIDAGIGWSYDGKKFTPPPQPAPTPEDLIQQAELQKQYLIDQANGYIDSKQWPSKLALGRLSDADKVLFNQWLDYLDALEAVDTSMAPEVVWPEMPVV